MAAVLDIGVWVLDDEVDKHTCCSQNLANRLRSLAESAVEAEEQDTGAAAVLLAMSGRTQEVPIDEPTEGHLLPIPCMITEDYGNGAEKLGAWILEELQVDETLPPPVSYISVKKLVDEEGWKCWRVDFPDGTKGLEYTYVPDREQPDTLDLLRTIRFKKVPGSAVVGPDEWVLCNCWDQDNNTWTIADIGRHHFPPVATQQGQVDYQEFQFINYTQDFHGYNGNFGHGRMGGHRQ